MEKKEVKIKNKIDKLLPHLNERQRRIFLSAEAENIGYGGISIISRLSKVSRPTIIQGKKELNEKPLDLPRCRKPGGGRKTIYKEQPEILLALEKLIEPLTRGDPMSALRWTIKSTRNLSDELKKSGYKVSHMVVSQMLKHLGYSLQSNQKKHEGGKHPDRNQQFEYINHMVENFTQQHDPAISIDTKKKEQVGNYKNNGTVLCKEKTPNEVEVYDFAKEKAVPYGIYDINKNEGYVNVGTNYDTSKFAVESIRRWWLDMGKEKYPQSKKLLITADGGGSNGSRRKLWKTELQKFADETQLEITVCHFPPGTSKWNKIEHRLFSQITLNWKGKPLESYEIIVNLIAATKTRKGLKVKAVLDENIYKKGIVVTKQELEEVNKKEHEFHGEWNYTIHPKTQ
jgi:transposase